MEQTARPGQAQEALCTEYYVANTPGRLWKLRGALTTVCVSALIFCLISARESRESSAALLILPSGEREELLWERSLIVYDQLSHQQTTIAEVSVTHAPPQFAILIATPRTVAIEYTTTRIWHYLKRHLKRRVISSSSLSFDLYSLFAESFTPPQKDHPHVRPKVGVFKSNDTQIHLEEMALHEWLIQRGLSLTPEQALSIRQTYLNGYVVTALWVKPQRRSSPSNNPLSETWTSTWIFTHDAERPHYTSLYAQGSQQLYGGHKERSHPQNSRALKLYFLLESQISLFEDPKLERHDKRRYTPLLSKQLGRFEVGELNSALITSGWSYRRGGVLTAFELNAPDGLVTLNGQLDVDSPLITPPAERRERVHMLRIPLELIILSLIIAFIGWKRWLRRQSM